MSNYYEQIQGWFDFADIYDMAIESVKSDRTHRFVEIGCWRGKSFCYLCQKILESEKYIFAYAIDTWLGTEGEQIKLATEAGGHEAIYQEFLKHRKEGGFEEFTHVIRKSSVDAIHEFRDGVVDFLFLDDLHTYDHVKNNIALWLPKMRPGSIIAGHDVDSDGVQRAVGEAFGDKVHISNVSWFVRL